MEDIKKTDGYNSQPSACGPSKTGQRTLETFERQQIVIGSAGMGTSLISGSRHLHNTGIWHGPLHAHDHLGSTSSAT